MPWLRHPSMRTSRSSTDSTRHCSPRSSSVAARRASRRRSWRSRRRAVARSRLGPALDALIPGAEVLHFPAWETLPHERLSPSPEIVGTPARGARPRRAVGRARRRCRHGVGPRRHPAARRRAHRRRARSISSSASAATISATVSARLVELAYHRVDMVSRRGEFAVRGGILDVFPPTADASLPRRVLRRRGRPDPSVLGRRPAVAAGGGGARCRCSPRRELLLTDRVRARARHCGTSSRASRPCSRRWPRASPSKEWSRSFPSSRTASCRWSTTCPRAPRRSRSSTPNAPSRARHARATQPRVPRRRVECRDGRCAGADRPRRRRLPRRCPNCAKPPTTETGSGGELSGFDSGAADAAAEGLVSRCRRSSRPRVVRVPGAPVPRSRETSTAPPRTWASSSLTAGGSWSPHPAPAWSTVRVDVLAERGIAARTVDDGDGCSRAGRRARRSFDARTRVSSARRRSSPSSPRPSSTVARSAAIAGRQEARVAPGNVVDPLQLKPATRRALDARHRKVRRTGRSARYRQGGRNPVKSVREYLVLEYAPSKRGFPGDKLFVPTDPSICSRAMSAARHRCSGQNRPTNFAFLKIFFFFFFFCRLLVQLVCTEEVDKAFCYRRRTQRRRDYLRSVVFQ